MSQSEPQSTRAKLLSAATEVFVAEGFERTSIRAIAGRAEANVAAVSYHFGGKEELYRAVIEDAFQRLPDNIPMPRLADDPTRPEDCLRRWIHWHFERVLGSGRHVFSEILMREMREPTATMRDFCDHAMRPVFASLCEIVGDLIEEDAESRAAREAAVSVLSQYVIFRHAEHLIDLFIPEFHRDPQFCEGMAERISVFSIAGLRALRAARKA